MSKIRAFLEEFDESLDYLERAQQFGTISPERMRNDKDLEALHGHPRYEALLGKASN